MNELPPVTLEVRREGSATVGQVWLSGVTYTLPATLNDTSVILADGSESFNLMALGNVRIADTTRLGGILLHTGTGDDVLLGRQFLGLFRKTLVMTGGALWLVDSEQVEDAINEVAREIANRNVSSALLKFSEVHGCLPPASLLGCSCRITPAE